MVVKSYESKSTVDRLKELEKIVFKTHNPLEVQDVMKNVEAYANTIYNQALDDVDNIITEQLDKSDNQVECQTLRWVLDVLSGLIK